MDNKKGYSNIVDLMRDVVNDDNFINDLESHINSRRISRMLFSMRCRSGKTQNEVAKYLKWSQGKVSKFENTPDDKYKFGDLVQYLDCIGIDMQLEIPGRHKTHLAIIHNAVFKRERQ